VYKYVEGVIAPNIEFSEMIVNRQAQVGNKARRPYLPDGLYIGDIPYAEIVSNAEFVVKMKGAVEGVGIDRDAKKAYKDYRQEIKIFHIFLGLLFHVKRLLQRRLK
jgi:hypothetical protein